MRCVINVTVTNTSRLTVHVSDAVAPFLGPRTGAVVTAENAEPGSGDGIDALFPLDRELGAGDAMTFDVVLVLHPDGCNQGVTFFSENWPTVTVDVLGRSHRLSGDKDFAFHRGGATPGCSRE